MRLAVVDLAHREGVGAGLLEGQGVERDAAVGGVPGGRHDLAGPALELEAELARLELGALEHLGGAQPEGDGRGLVAVGERHRAIARGLALGVRELVLDGERAVAGIGDRRAHAVRRPVVGHAARRADDLAQLVAVRAGRGVGDRVERHRSVGGVPARHRDALAAVGGNLDQLELELALDQVAALELLVHLDLVGDGARGGADAVGVGELECALALGRALGGQDLRGERAGVGVLDHLDGEGLGRHRVVDHAVDRAGLAHPVGERLGAQAVAVDRGIIEVARLPKRDVAQLDVAGGVAGRLGHRLAGGVDRGGRAVQRCNLEGVLARDVGLRQAESGLAECQRLGAREVDRRLVGAVAVHERQLTVGAIGVGHGHIQPALAVIGHLDGDVEARGGRRHAGGQPVRIVLGNGIGDGPGAVGRPGGGAVRCHLLERVGGVGDGREREHRGLTVAGGLVGRGRDHLTVGIADGERELARRRGAARQRLGGADGHTALAAERAGGLVGVLERDRHGRGQCRSVVGRRDLAAGDLDAVLGDRGRDRELARRGIVAGRDGHRAQRGVVGVALAAELGLGDGEAVGLARVGIGELHIALRGAADEVDEVGRAVIGRGYGVDILAGLEAELGGRLAVGGHGEGELPRLHGAAGERLGQAHARAGRVVEPGRVGVHEVAAARLRDRGRRGREVTRAVVGHGHRHRGGLAVVGDAGNGRAVSGPDLAHRVGEGLGAHALAADLGEPGVPDVVERVADGAEVEGDLFARLGPGGGRHADGLGAVGGPLGHGRVVLARERELEAVALRPVAALERLGEESRRGDAPALGGRPVRVGKRDGRAGLGHGALGPLGRGRVALGRVLGHGVARAHGQAGDGLLPAVLELEGRLAVRELHGVPTLAEGAGDGLAVPVGQRDREAELALAVAADDRLLDGEAAGLSGVGKDRRLDRTLGSITGIVGQLCNLGLGSQLAGAVVGHRDGGAIGGLREGEGCLVTRLLGNHIGIGAGLGVLDGAEVANLNVLLQRNRRHTVLGALGHGRLALGSQRHGKGIRRRPVASGDFLLDLKGVLHLRGLRAVDVGEADLRCLSDGALPGVRLVGNRKAVLVRHEVALGVELLHLVVRAHGHGNRHGATGLKRDGVTALDLSAYIGAVGAAGTAGIRKATGQRRCAIGLEEQHLKGECLVGRGNALGCRNRLAQRQAAVRDLIGGGVGLDGRVVADRHRRLVGDVTRSTATLKRVLGHTDLKLNRALLAGGNIRQLPGEIDVLVLGAGILMVARELHELGPRRNGIGDRHRSRRALGILVADGIGELIAQRHTRPRRILSIALGLLGHIVGRGTGIALVADRNGGIVLDGADSAPGVLHGILGNLDAHAHRTVAARRLLAQGPGERLAVRGALIGVLALKGFEHNAGRQFVGHGHIGRNQIVFGIGLGVNPVDGVDIGVTHGEQLPVDVHIGLRDRADRLDLVTCVVEDDLAVLGTIAIGHLGRKVTVVVVGHLEQHTARRGRIHGTNAIWQVGQALLCHQVKAVGSGVVGIVALVGKAICHFVGKIDRLLFRCAGIAAELKGDRTKVDRCGIALARLGRALINRFKRAVGFLRIQVKRILTRLDLVAGVHYLLGSKTVECSGRGIAVGEGYPSLDRTVHGVLFTLRKLSPISIKVLDRGHGIERTIGALVNRNRHRPIGRIVGVATLVVAVLDHLVGERLARIFRREGQATQNTGV